MGTRPLAQYISTWEYLLPDALGSVRQIADAAGNVTLAKSYEPYGAVLTSTGTASSIFGYSGEVADTTGLVYLRARYMQPTLGMFLARDPWSGDQLRPGSMNGWNYGSGNPVKYTDPSGLSPNVDCSQWSSLLHDLCVKSNGQDNDPAVLDARWSLFNQITAAGLIRGQVKFGWDYTTSGYTWAARMLMHFLDGNGSDYNIRFNSGDPFVNDPGITRATRGFGDPASRDEADFIVPLLHDFLGNYVQPAAVNSSSFSVGPVSLDGASHYINDPSKTLGLEPRARDQGFWAAWAHVTIDGVFAANGGESCRWNDFYLLSYKADYSIKDRYEWFKGKKTPFPFGNGGSTVYIPHEWEKSLVDAGRAAEFNVNISWTEEDRLLVSHDFTQYRPAVWWDW